MDTIENINFEKKLDCVIAIRMTSEEYEKVSTIARTNFLSQSELIRNILRINIHQYILSEDLKKRLIIAEKIEQILLERRLIARKMQSNLSKIREILTDFEESVDTLKSNIDFSAIETQLDIIIKLVEFISKEDTFLFSKIEPQMNRILKNKNVKIMLKNKYI